MKLPRPRPRPRHESTITLINIVFLMLIFFLIAGTLTPPMERDVALITTSQSDRAEPPRALFVTSDGALLAAGAPVTAAGYVERLRAASDADGAMPLVKVAADRALPARQLIDIVAALRDAGAGRIVLVTERGETP
ncbi:MAG: biopolymer transporter ExbD [Nitratireductor sp.]|jgi:biopolymer transport protein ExbD